MPKVAVIRTGLANLASVLAGLRRAGGEPEVTEDPAVVRAATHAVLPGVGAFGAAMTKLDPSGLAEEVRARIAANRPTLCVCLGLQLLTEQSEETPGVRGLGVLPIHIRRFSGDVRVPQLGWNRVEAPAGARYLQSGYAYFANSFYAPSAPEGWLPAHTEHGVRFVSALERGNILACQFHPELSGDWGAALLKRWVETPVEVR